MSSRRSRGAASLTVWSLIALAVGLAVGALGHGSRAIGFTILGEIVEPLGRLWLASLQMTVLPLVVIYLLAAIVGAGGRDPLGTLGTRAVALFIAMLLLAALFTLIVTPPLITAASPDAGAFALLRESTPVPQAARDAAAAGATSISEWIGNLLPSNLFEAARRGDVLPLLIFSALLAFAIRQLPDERRGPLQNGLEALSEALFILVRWLLAATPLGVFALSYAPWPNHRTRSGRRSGRARRAAVWRDGRVHAGAVSAQRTVGSRIDRGVRARGGACTARCAFYAIIDRVASGAGRRCQRAASAAAIGDELRPPAHGLAVQDQPPDLRLHEAPLSGDTCTACRSRPARWRRSSRAWSC